MSYLWKMCLWPQNKFRSQWPIFHGPGIFRLLFFALLNILVLLAKFKALTSDVGALQLGWDVTFMKSWLRQCIANESVYIYFQLCLSPPAWFSCRLHKVLVTTVYHQQVCIYIFSVMLGAHQLGLDVAIMKSWLRQCITNKSVYIYFQLCWSPSAWFRCRHHEVLVTTVYHQWVCVYIFSVMLEPISLV